MRLSETGELGLLRTLEERGLIVGTEHDAAELADGLVVTQDALVERVHFELDRMSWRELGFRAAAVNISDLSASAARPEALIVTLALPAETEVADVVELYEGMAEAGVPVRGGDTTSAGHVALSVTAIGRSARVPGRAGAGPGDAVVVTGPLGAAGAAFREGRFLRPPLRTEEGVRLGAVATAMLDVSDGLALDAARVARASGVRIALDASAVALAAPGASLAAALHGGEDHALLVTLPAGVTPPPELAGHPVRRIGAVEAPAADEGGTVTLDGEPLEPRGWDPYRAG